MASSRLLINLCQVLQGICREGCPYEDAQARGAKTNTEEVHVQAEPEEIKAIENSCPGSYGPCGQRNHACDGRRAGLPIRVQRSYLRD